MIDPCRSGHPTHQAATSWPAAHQPEHDFATIVSAYEDVLELPDGASPQLRFIQEHVDGPERAPLDGQSHGICREHRYFVA